MTREEEDIVLKQAEAIMANRAWIEKFGHTFHLTGGFVNPHGVWEGAYIRLGTCVHHRDYKTTGVVTRHDGAWNCHIEFDFKEYRIGGFHPWVRVPDVLRADGSPLQDEDLTPINGAGR